MRNMCEICTKNRMHGRRKVFFETKGLIVHNEHARM
jgi:hypothetical protein